MATRNKQLKKIVPPITSIEDRFKFIEDDILRMNIALALQYIIVLIGTMDKEKVENTSIASAFYKDMIIYYGSIVESCLHYCLKVYFEKGEITSDKVMPSGEWKYIDVKTIHKIDADKEVCGGLRHKKVEELNNSTNFVIINRAAQKAKILNKSLFERVENLRKFRNKIHLAGLQGIDNKYNKHDVRKFLNTATLIVQRVESKLAAL